MRRILGFSTNDHTLNPHVFARLGPPLQAALASPVASWGLGYDQESQALVRKRPEEIGVVDLASTLLTLRAEALVAFSSGAPSPQRREENTEPFRYRAWMMVSLGSLDGLAPGALPRHPALQGAASGSALAEEVFLHLLGELRERSVSWTDPQPPLDRVRAAVAATLDALASRLERPEGFALLLLHERALLGGTLGEPLYTASLRGLEILREADPIDRAPQRRLTFGHLRASAVLGGVHPPQEGWERIDGPAVFSLAPSGERVVEAR